MNKILKFLKYNKSLTVTVGAAIVVAFIFIVLILNSYSNRSTALVALKDIKTKIEFLNNMDPSPTRQNIKLLNEDLTNLKSACFGFEALFGNTLQKPLLSFVLSLRETKINTLKEKLESKDITEQEKNNISEQLKLLSSVTDNNILLIEFISSWKDFLKKMKYSVFDSNMLLTNFIKSEGYTEDELNVALDAFKKTFEDNFFEDINAANIDDYVLEALGADVEYSKIKCKNLVLNVEDKLLTYLKDYKVKTPNGKLNFFEELTTLPSDEQIPYIITYIRFLDDLFSRIADANFYSIVSYRRLNGLTGTSKDGFTTIKYQLNLIGTQQSIRNFLNSLQSAYQNNKIYSVRRISLKTMDDTVDKIPPYDPQKEDLNPQLKVYFDSKDLISVSIDLDYIVKNKES